MITESICPNCLSLSMRVFHELRGVPLRCNVLFEDEGSALEDSKGDLVLGFCGRCAFIGNLAFDPDVGIGRDGYEDRQSFSPRFCEFQSQLIASLLARHNLHGKNVVEIGCGKGDFLRELCQAGGNCGVGIDPIATAGEEECFGPSQVRFIADRFGRQHASVPCDFLCCRHTLEHIPDTNSFLHLVRDVIGSRVDIAVMFEVPEVTRILREVAFWDLYYEHCSYFCGTSLTRLFQLCGFHVQGAETVYDDQYLVVSAVPVEEPGEIPAGDQDITQVGDLVDQFVAGLRAKIDCWRSRLERWRASNRRVAIWGSGSKCVSFIASVGCADAVDCVVDINPHRHGKFLPVTGKEIVSPESLCRSRPDVIVIMNPVYRDEIEERLIQLGVDAAVEVV